jgi:tRNA nucleotidyltransferase/poly(A) polymerase
MKLSELLQFVSLLAEKRGISKPFIVGGIPRDKLLKKYNDFTDIDITTGDAGVHYLAKELATILNVRTNDYKVLPDGHAQIMIEDLKLDFSSNFKVPGIANIIRDAGVTNPSEMHKELYSRDFTCNAALMTMGLDKILDPTGLAVNDIKSKIIKTCLPPNVTFGYDYNRIARAIYFSAKLGFDIDNEIIEWVKTNPQAITKIKQKYLVKKLKEALKHDEKRTVAAVDKMGIWQHVPPLKEIMPFMYKSPERV